MATKQSKGTNGKAPATPVGATEKAVAAGHFSYSGKLDDGTPVTLVHVFRRRYTVALNGKPAGYITAKSPDNAIGRVNVATKATLKLH